jgi:hypothetical protein
VEHAAPGRELFVLSFHERHGGEGLQQLRAFALAEEILEVFES